MFTHTTTTTKINYEGLDVGSAANYHLRRVSWPQSVGSYPFLFSHFSPEISRPSAPSKLDEEP